MKSAVIYYSYSGNTKRVARILLEYLREKGEVEVIELKALDEPKNFFKQAARAFKHKQAEIEPVNFALSGFDIICLGTPVWAFAPTPAMNTYLAKCTGVAGKEIILFVTCGSGSGVNRCFDYMQDILVQKGARECKRIIIPQRKIKDRELVLAKIRENMRL